MIIYADLYDAGGVWRPVRIDVCKDKNTGFTTVINVNEDGQKGDTPSLRLTGAEAGRLLVAIASTFEPGSK